MSSKTLEELEGDIWPEPSFRSHLVVTCHRLRKKPLEEFGVDDLRIMLGQGIGVAHLLPIAVAVLEREPLAEGGFYPGDLLAAILRVRVRDKAVAVPRELAARLHSVAAAAEQELHA